MVNVLNNGKIIVAWESQAQDGSGLGIYAQGINNDLSKFGPEFKVNNRTKFNQKNLSCKVLNINTMDARYSFL